MNGSYQFKKDLNFSRVIRSIKYIPCILTSSQNPSQKLILLTTISNNRYTLRISHTYPRVQKKPIDCSETPKSQNLMLTSIECEWCLIDVVMSHHCIEGSQQLGDGARQKGAPFK